VDGATLFLSFFARIPHAPSHHPPEAADVSFGPSHPCAVADFRPDRGHVLAWNAPLPATARPALSTRYRSHHAHAHRPAPPAPPGPARTRTAPRAPGCFDPCAPRPRRSRHTSPPAASTLIG